MNNELDILFDKDAFQKESSIYFNESEYRGFNIFALKTAVCLFLANFSLPQG